MNGVLLSEWTKTRTVGSTVWTPVVAFAALPLFALIVALTGSLHPTDTVLAASLTGALFGQLGSALLGVLVICPEYHNGMIRTTFAASPRRSVVLVSKAAVVTAIGLLGGLVAGAAAYAVGRAMLTGHPPGQPFPALLGVAMACVAAGWLGLAAGVLVRHTAGAFTLAVGVILLPSMLGPVLGAQGRWLVMVAPGTAVQKLAGSTDVTAETAGSLGAWTTLALLCGYTAAALVAGGWVLRRRGT